MPMRTRNRVSLAVLFSMFLLGAATVAAPVNPPDQSSPEESSPDARLPDEVLAYLEEALATMRREALHSSRVDWTALRKSTFEKASGSTSRPATYPAIRHALAGLGDGHSFLQLSEALREAERTALGTAPEHDGPKRHEDGRTPSPFARRMQPESSLIEAGSKVIGRLVMPQGIRDNAFATQFQKRIARLDSQQPCGWIVDLRGNGGGATWPMLAGLGPLLGDGPVGGSVEADGTKDIWSYSDGKAIYENSDGERSVYAEVTRTPYVPQAMLPVAVLIDRGTASSGEAMALAFRGRPTTRSFGERTYGASTSTLGFRLSDGANLVLAVSIMTDRDHTEYPAGVEPDEPVPCDDEALAQGDPVLDAAVTWLLAQDGGSDPARAR